MRLWSPDEIWCSEHGGDAKGSQRDENNGVGGENDNACPELAVACPDRGAKLQQGEQRDDCEQGVVAIVKDDARRVECPVSVVAESSTEPQNFDLRKHEEARKEAERESWQEECDCADVGLDETMTVVGFRRRVHLLFGLLFDLESARASA